MKKRTSCNRKLIKPVAMMGLSIHRYHAAHLLSSQVKLLKSVLAYSNEADEYADEVTFDMIQNFF